MSLKDQDFDTAAQQLLRNFEAAPAVGSWALVSARLPEGRRKSGVLWGVMILLVFAGLGMAAFDSLRERRDMPTNADFNTTPQWGEGDPLQSKRATATEWDSSPAPEQHRGSIAARSGAAFDSLRECRHGPTSHKAVNYLAAKPSSHKKVVQKLDEELIKLSNTAGATTSRVAVAAVSPNLNSTPTDIIHNIKVATTSSTIYDYSQVPLSSVIAVLSDDKFSLGPDIPCPTFGKGKQWVFGVRANVGPGIVMRDVEAPSSELRNYARLRDSVEERQLQPRVGLYVEAVHSSGLFVRGGVDYRMYRSRVRARGPQTQTTTLVEVRDPISNNLIRTDTTITVSTSTSTVYNRVQTVTPVVGLGFQKTFGRVTPYVLAQAGFELTLKSRGTVPDPLGVPVDLNQTDEYITRQPGFQLGGAVGFDVSLHEQWAVGLSVDYLQLGSLRDAEDPIDYRQSAVTPGLNLVYRL